MPLIKAVMRTTGDIFSKWTQFLSVYLPLSLFVSRQSAGVRQSKAFPRLLLIPFKPWSQIRQQTMNWSTEPLITDLTESWFLVLARDSETALCPLIPTYSLRHIKITLFIHLSCDTRRLRGKIWPDLPDHYYGCPSTFAKDTFRLEVSFMLKWHRRPQKILDLTRLIASKG